jgi:hypothetical protein
VQVTTEAVDGKYIERTISLDGSASSDDEGAVTYAWTFDGVNAGNNEITGTFTSATSKTTNFTAGGYGTYTFTLTVTDTAEQTDAVTSSVEMGKCACVCVCVYVYVCVCVCVCVLVSMQACALTASLDVWYDYYFIEGF